MSPSCLFHARPAVSFLWDAPHSSFSFLVARPRALCARHQSILVVASTPGLRVFCPWTVSWNSFVCPDCLVCVAVLRCAVLLVPLCRAPYGIVLVRPVLMT
eukprot:3526681-Prymnesium_polylepis.1